MAELVVELEAIRANTAAVVTLLRSHGLNLVAVTKGCLGDAHVAEAMLEGGATALADTRNLNLLRLRAAFPGVELHRIYLPPSRGHFHPGDITYVSSPEAAEVLARSEEETHRVMILVETGDLREGAPEEELDDLVGAVLAHPGLELEGLATNYACFEGSAEGILGSVETLAAAARRLRAAGVSLPRLSGGNSSLLSFLAAGHRLPPEVNELRCGESLLLGHDALFYEPLPGCRPDACVVRAEVLEGYTKAVPGGTERRLVLGLGSQDLGSGPVRFVLEGLRERGRSSDYLIAALDEDFPAAEDLGYVEMIPSYPALVAAWISPYVEVRIV